jgi:hypothetical protein
MKKTMNLKTLHISGNLVGLMTSTGKSEVTAAGYTLKKENGIYTVTDKDGKIIDQWQGLPESKFETK